MDFVEFVKITRPILGGKSNVQVYVKTLFDSIMKESGKDILDGYKPSTFKSYANGNTSISNISKAMSPQHLDPDLFASFVFETEEPAQIALCEAFSEYLPNINPQNVGYEIADLFENIIRTAARSKRKTPTSDNDIGADLIEIPESQSTDVFPYPPKDEALLKEFTSDFDGIMLKIISENYAVSLIDMSFLDTIKNLYNHKWESKADNFLDPKLKSYVFGLLGELNSITDGVINEYIQATTLKNSRTKIRNLYVKLHPELYSGEFPYAAFIDDWNETEF